MVNTLIEELIDKQDTFEAVRTQIYNILIANVANQKTLAAAAGKDPDLWDLDIVEERSNPFEKFLKDGVTDKSPIVNVWFDSDSFDEPASGLVEQQTAEPVYNIDCYGYGISANTAGGHDPGDRIAAIEVQRSIRLVRNILMAGIYTYLEIGNGNGIITSRWIDSINMYQPQIDSRPVQNVVGARIAFKVRCNEFSPQYIGPELELISAVTQISDNVDENVNTDYPKT